MTVGNSDVPKRRVSLQTEQTEQTDLQTESQGQQVADKLPASEKLAKVENETFSYNLSDEVEKTEDNLYSILMAI